MTVALEITPETERRSKRIAAEAKQPVEAALNAALDALEGRKPVEQCTRPRTREERRAIIERAVAAFNAMPVLDPRTPDEILGYDQHGLPA